MSSRKRESRAGRFLRGLCFAYPLLCAAHLARLGFGNDNDTYRMLATWQHFRETGFYEPSRFQGSLIPEFAIGFIASIGGYVASNVVSIALGVGTLVLFYRIITQYTAVPRPAWPVLLVACNPYWILASSTSMDYVYGAFFFMGGSLALFSRRPLVAALLFAVSASSRISYFGLAALFLAAWVCTRRDPQQRRVVTAGIFVFLLTTTLLYVPVFIASQLKFDFLGAAYVPTGGLAGRFARALYKLIYLVDVPTILFLAIAVWLNVRAVGPRMLRSMTWTDGILALPWIVIAYHILLFLALPVEVSYLIPLLFALPLLLSHAPRWLLPVLVCCQIAFGWVRCEALDIRYRSDEAGAAKIAESASFRPHFRAGVILDDVRERGRTQAYFERYREQGELPRLFGWTSPPPDSGGR